MNDLGFMAHQHTRRPYHDQSYCGPQTVIIGFYYNLKQRDSKVENHVTYFGYFVPVFGQNRKENCSVSP